MATAYPGALDTVGSQLRTDIASSDDLDASGKEHDVMHVNVHGATVALETKLGLTASNAVDGAILVGTAASTTAWTTSPAINITGNASGTAATVTGAAQTAITSVGALTGLTVGSDGSGGDVTFHSDTAGDAFVWDSSDEKLTITGTDGQTALDVPDGNVTITDTLTVSGGLVAPLAINAQTGTTYTFVIADAGKMVTSSNGSAQTVTVPPNSSVAFVVGTQIIVQNIGSANATLAEGSGVTINSKDDNKEIDGQYAAATLIKTATDVWSLIGALA